MTGAEHYREAERLAACGDLAAAQLHATLATAASGMEQAATADAGLYSVRQAAERWGQRVKTVQQWVARGHVHTTRIGGRRFIPGSEVTRIGTGGTR